MGQKGNRWIGSGLTPPQTIRENGAVLLVQAYWYFDEVTGEFNHRIRKPGEALAALEGVEVLNCHIHHPLFPDLAMQADLLILHLVPDEEVPSIIRIRKALEKPTIFELADNFLQIGDWVAQDDAYRNPDNRAALLNHARLCDALQVSTPAVAKVFSGLNPNTFVFENQSDHFSRVFPDDQNFVVGWGGSRGHASDLRAIRPVLEAFLADHDDAVFSYMGAEDVFRDVFAGMPQAQYRAAGPLEEYYDFLNALHVGLAPLADTPFNHCRSDIKFVEYASHTVVPLLADAEPYRAHALDGENALVYGSPEVLRSYLERLYQDRAFCRALAERAYAYSSRERVWQRHAEHRLEVYRRLCDRAPETNAMPDLPDCSGLITYVRKACAAYDRGDFHEALGDLDRVLGLHPGYQQAHLWRAKTLAALGAFKELWDGYVGFEVHVLYRDILIRLLAQAARAMSLPEESKLLEQVYPDGLGLRHLFPDHGNHSQVLERILAANPYDFQALLDLAVLKARDGRTLEEALTLVDRALIVLPEAGPIRDLKRALEQALSENEGK